MSEVLTFGETMVLLTTPNRSGKINHSQTLVKQIGGAESNVAIALARLGHEVEWISRVGKDPFGEEILYHLRAEGVNVSNVIIDQKHPTGMMLKERPIKGDPNVFYYRNGSAASNLQQEDIKRTCIRSAQIMHITGITLALSESCRDTVFEAVNRAKEAGVKISIDPNLRLKLWSIEEARPVLMKLIKQSDYFFPGIDEARLLLNKPNYSAEKIIHEFLELGIRQIILKLGPEGCIVANNRQIAQVEGIQVPEVDTVGAGDGFSADYLSGVLSGLSEKECAKRANIVGALAVTAESDYGGYPTREELETV